MRKLLLSFLFFAGCILGHTQFVKLLNFDSANGANPRGSLILSGKTLYGITTGGGNVREGRVFSLDTNGNNYKDLLDFMGSNGNQPFGSLILAGKTLFGTTRLGGSGGGCIFSIDTTGNNYRDLSNFVSFPVGSLIFFKSRLYGLAPWDGRYGYGCVFSMDTNGSGYTDLFDFNDTNGANPFGSLILSGSKLFGMTYRGGANGDGVAFSVDTTGNNFKDLIEFNGLNGKMPYGDLMISGSTLFGMTSVGGANTYGNVFSIDTNGSNYQDLFDFSGGINGSTPYGSLVLANGALCGMTKQGGTYFAGNIFSINASNGWYKDMFDFQGPNGATPTGNLTFSGNVMYGMTQDGGTGAGIVFKYRFQGLGLNEVSQHNQRITLYPNPNNGVFTIESSVVSGKSSVIEIYNVLGEKIYSKSFSIDHSALNINLSGQSAGIYLYRILSDDGKMAITGKFVIE